MQGIAEMFAELDGYQRYADALERWSAWRGEREREYGAAYRAQPGHRQRAVERTRAWRQANPDRSRELNRRMHLRWKQNNPEAYREKNRRAKRLYKQRYPEKVRERDRRNQAARRARIKAQASGQLAGGSR